MILVDTSVWIDHFRTGVPQLAAALNDLEVCMHPFVLGELACGNFRDRRELLGFLANLPGIPRATDDEATGLIERRALMGRGIGLIDVHLLASCALAGTARLWTHDKRLARVAAELELDAAWGSAALGLRY